MHSYPVFLDLRGRPCLVIGSGALAEEKVQGLLAAGAVVTHRPDGYQDGDLEGMFLAIVCGQPPEIAETVWQEASRRGVLLNTVDDPPRCGFIAPAIVRRGDLAVAISTNGKAPALAVRLRQRLEGELGEEYGRFLELAGTVRAPLAAQRPDFAERRELWYRLVDSDVLDLLREGEDAAARDRFAEILGVAPA
ncbi:MAG TPA: bifunctional precorrin-2 dehydrogenase/sirohydrochlorin ferrochelatase [Thermoanaerobaculia bacterium]|nr:bifunctional precorrin-2 dehydrogenase/sirohydrochlorin ferrochelatase [Thermoanaerobaculia bacterium]